jgi:hypothetical protein
MAVTLDQAGALIVAGDIIKFSAFTFFSNQLGMINATYLIGTVTGAPTMGAAAVSIGTAVDASLAAAMTSVATIVGYRVQKINTPFSQGLAGIALSASPGTAGATPLPTQVRGLVSYYSNKTGPAGRGRIYVPFPSTAATTTGNVPNAAYQALLQTLGNDIFSVTSVGSGGNTAIATQVICNRKTFATQVVLFAVTSNLFATQRRSGAYGRPNSDLIPR